MTNKVKLFLFWLLVIFIFSLVFITGFLVGFNAVIPDNITIELGESYERTVDKLVNLSANRNITNVTAKCPDCICPVIPKCPDCVCNLAECKPQVKTVIKDDCTNKLNMCNIRLDNLNNEYFNLLQYNTSKYSENLTIEYKRCIEDKKKLQDRIDNITKLIS